MRYTGLAGHDSSSPPRSTIDSFGQAPQRIEAGVRAAGGSAKHGSLPRNPALSSCSVPNHAKQKYSTE
jgi:hypothetical protein